MSNSEIRTTLRISEYVWQENMIDYFLQCTWDLKPPAVVYVLEVVVGWEGDIPPATLEPAHLQPKQYIKVVVGWEGDIPPATLEPAHLQPNHI